MLFGTFRFHWVQERRHARGSTQSEQHRGFIKIVELLKKQARDEEKAAKDQGFTSNQTSSITTEPPAKSTPLDSRNEAIARSSGNPSKQSNVVESERSKQAPGKKKVRQARRHRN